MRVLISLIWLMIAGMAAAQTSTQSRIDVTLRGIKLGEFQLTGAQDARRYTASAQFLATGLVGSIRGVRFWMKATGSHAAGRYRPVQYSENVTVGRRQAAAQLSYPGGIPMLTGIKLGTEDSPALDPQDQRDTVDPLTALFIALRDQPAEGLCTLNQPIFDGARRTRAVLSRGPVREDAVICTGTVTRQAGYSPEQLAERRQFRMTLTYKPVGPVMQLRSVRFASLFGTVEISRR